jgi:UDP-glucose:(heptosyl)LPS alpha-1,3-glucosyltransferase
MRIALVGRRFDPEGGGTERDLLITARILDRAGHAITLYAGEVRRRSTEFDVRPVGWPVPNRALRLLMFANAAAAIARRDGAEIVLSFARITGADILRSGGGAHSSYVRAARQWLGPGAAAAMRLSPYHRAQIAIERRGYESGRLRRAIAVSELVRRDLIGSFGLDPEKAATLYNGVDLDRFTPANRDMRGDARRALGIPEDAIAVAFVGNGFARKGLRFLIEAWPALEARPYLIAAGADRSVTAYRRLAARIGVGERIVFAGPQSRIELTFAAADAFAMPSLFEPFGNVIMEAMASGLPALCSSACGAAEAFAGEMREFVVGDPANPGEIAARMNSLLKNRDWVSAAARAAAEQFTWERYGRGLLALLSSL